MVLRVKPTLTRFPTNSLYTPVDKHTLAFYIKCVPPVGRAAAVSLLRGNDEGLLHVVSLDWLKLLISDTQCGKQVFLPCSWFGHNVTMG